MSRLFPAILSISWSAVPCYATLGSLQLVVRTLTFVASQLLCNLSAEVQRYTVEKLRISAFQRYIGRLLQTSCKEVMTPARSAVPCYATLGSLQLVVRTLTFVASQLLCNLSAEVQRYTVEKLRISAFQRYIGRLLQTSCKEVMTPARSAVL